MEGLKKIGLLCLVLGLVYTCAAMDGREFYGRVTSEGKGVAGVVVTDGYTVTTTGRDGRYEFAGHPAAEFVHIVLPAGYEVPVKDEVPCFYRRADGSLKRQKFDFTLIKNRHDDDKQVIIAGADPQVYFDEELPVLQKIADDMKNLIEVEYAGMSVHGMICGDVIGDIKRNPDCFHSVKHIFHTTGIPFFYVPGNHDMDMGKRSDELSKATYSTHFGPTWYAFNRGKIHYIVLDGVFALGKDYLYTGYLDERQLKWLELYLALVPEGAVIVVLTHIPTYSREARSGNYANESASQVINNRNHLYDLLKPYRVQVLSGHTHYQENYVVTDNVYEHVQASLSGLFWQAPWCGDGTPVGYTVYEIEGEHISWYYKPVGEDKAYQFRAYPVGENYLKPEALTVNVWNYDPAWKVYWYEDEKKMGEMERYTGIDPVIDRYVVENRKDFRYNYIGAEPTEHLFFAIPRSADAVIRVEVVDRFGRVYRDSPRKLEEWINGRFSR